MLPVLHPLSKTSIEIRRAINRLLVFKDQFPDDPHVANVTELIEDLRAARAHIPTELRDPDLKENE